MKFLSGRPGLEVVECGEAELQLELPTSSAVSAGTLFEASRVGALLGTLWLDTRQDIAPSRWTSSTTPSDFKCS